MPEKNRKFHIANGVVNPCKAELRACPYGAEDHFGTVQEANAALNKNGATAAPKKKVSVSEAKKAWKEWSEGKDLASEKVPAEQREVLWQGYLTSYERDMRGTGVAAFVAEGATPSESLTDTEVEQLLEAQKKPMRLTSTEERKRDEAFKKYGVTQSDVDAYVGKFMVLTAPPLRGREWDFHPTRQLAAHTLSIPNMADKYEYVAMLTAQDREEQKRPDYRGWKKAKVMEQKSPGRTPKPLDPQMIEALKLKYLKRYKQPFDQSGLTIPELLKMAREGQLD